MLTGKGLVEFAKSKLGTPYVYGMKGAVLTTEKYNELKKDYANMVWNSDKNKIGKVCVDCSGLISWYTGKMYGSYQLKEKAVKSGPISTVKNAPIGAILWRSGHVGVYAGLENGVPYCYEAKGSAYGTVKSKVPSTSFTNWLLMDYIAYEGEDEVDIKKIKVNLNGTVKQVNAIEVDGHNYVKLQDLKDSKIEIKYSGMPIINTK